MGGVSLRRDADDTGSWFLTAAEVTGHSASPYAGQSSQAVHRSVAQEEWRRFFQEDGTAQAGLLLEEVALFV